MKQNDLYILTRLTKNIGIYIIYIYNIIPIYSSVSGNLISLESDFYIEYNIAATKSSFAATIAVSFPQCHLNLRESLIT